MGGTSATSGPAQLLEKVGPAWLVACLAAVVHAQAVNGGFVWLDHAHIGAGAAVAEPGAWLSLFTRGFADTGYYRPLMALVLSVDALVDSVRWYHLHSVVWHAAAAALLAKLALELGLSRLGALLCGGVAAVHPVSSLVAGAIAFRSESMLAVFLFGLIIFHLRKHVLGAACCIFLGCLSKETMFVYAPLALLVLSRRGGWKFELPQGRLLVGELLALCGALALWLKFAPAYRAGFPVATVDQAIGTRLAAITKSAKALLLPLDPTICDAIRIESVISASAAFGALAVGLLVFLAIKLPKLGLLAALSFVPILNLVPLSRFWSPHYLYVPLCLLALCFGKQLGSASLALKRGAGVLLGIFALVSFGQGSRYKDDVALWTPEETRQPICREAHFYLGLSAMQRRDFDSAAGYFGRAANSPSDAWAYVDLDAAFQNLGVSELARGRLVQAKAAFHRVLELSQDPSERRKASYHLKLIEIQETQKAPAQKPNTDPQ